ncbi:MAG: hypothetical protein HY870_20930 [Chloroflexi bacterium]|nr:hypothetical protein [Chloroflexota bacterium]
MSDYLSTANLLGLLQIDRQNKIMQLCEQSESLRRRRCYTEAIKISRNAVFLAKNDYLIMGAALLYLCSARMHSSQPEQEQMAIRECDRAIRALSHERFNRAIGEVLRAQIKAQFHSDDYLAVALLYYEQALKDLDGVALYTLEHKDFELLRIVEKLKGAVEHKIFELGQSLSGSESEKATVRYEDRRASRKNGPVTDTLLPQTSLHLRNDLSVPVKIVWPPQPLSLGFVPSDGTVAPDFIEIDKLSIQGRLYTIKSTSFLNSPDSIRIRINQQYFLVPLANGDSKEYALVRQWGRPDQPRQFVVASDPVSNDTWIDEAESIAPYSNIHFVGDQRDWVIIEMSEEQSVTHNAIKIIGIVEAVLTPTQ